MTDQELAHVIERCQKLWGKLFNEEVMTATVDHVRPYPYDIADKALTLHYGRDKYFNLATLMDIVRSLMTKDRPDDVAAKKAEKRLQDNTAYLAKQAAFREAEQPYKTLKLAMKAWGASLTDDVLQRLTDHVFTTNPAVVALLSRTPVGQRRQHETWLSYLHQAAVETGMITSPAF
jgi:hypothetical protein